MGAGEPFRYDCAANRPTMIGIENGPKVETVSSIWNRGLAKGVSQKREHNQGPVHGAVRGAKHNLKVLNI